MIDSAEKSRSPRPRRTNLTRPWTAWLWVGWTVLAASGSVALHQLPLGAWWGHGPLVAGVGHVVRLILAGFLFASAAAIGEGVLALLRRAGRIGGGQIDKQKYLSSGAGDGSKAGGEAASNKSEQSDKLERSDRSDSSGRPDRSDRSDQSDEASPLGSLLSVRAVLGLAVLTVVLFGLAAWELWKPTVFWVLFTIQGVALVVWGLQLHSPGPRSGKKSDGGGWRALFHSRERFAGWALALVYGLPSLLFALTPPFGWDDQVYHLPLPKAYLAHGGFFAMPWNFFAQQPGQMDLLYGWALAFGDGSVAALIHLGLGLTVCLGLWEIARRMGFRRAAWIAPALFLCHFMVGEEMGWAFSDVGMTAFLLAAWWTLWTWVRGRGGRYGWLVAGILAGVVCASKYTGGVLVAGVGAWALIAGVWEGRGSQTGLTGWVSALRGLRRLPRWGWRLGLGVAGFGLIAYLVLSFWLVKDFCFTGNPVWPLLYSAFDGRGWSIWLSRELLAWQRGDYGPGRSVLDWILLLPRVFFVSDYSADRFAGSLAVLPLLATALSLALPGKSRRMAWLPVSCFLLLFALWGLGSQQTRFLIPALPMLALGALPAVGEVFCSPSRRRRWVIGAALGGALVANLAGTALPRWQSVDKIRRVLLGLDSREAFLSVAVRSYGCFRHIEALPKKERGRYVLFLFEPMGYYAGFPHRFDVMEASPTLEEAGECGSGKAFARRLQVEGVDLVLVNHEIYDNFLPLLQGPPPFSLFGGDREILDHYRKGLRVVDDFLRHHAVEVYRSHNSAVYRVRP